MFDRNYKDEIKECSKELFEVKKFWENLGVNSTLLEVGNTLEVLATDELMDCVKKYKGEVANQIASEIVFTAQVLGDKDEVLMLARIFAQDEVVNTIGKYKGEVAREIAHEIVEATFCLKDEEAITETVKTIGKYKGKVAEEIAEAIVWAAYYLGDGKAITEIVRTIRKYESEAAKEIASKIAQIAHDLKDSSKVIRIVRMLEKADKSMFDILENWEIDEVINLGLDNLIKNKRDFDAIALYMRSNKELPLPTEKNINSYLDLAMNYVKSKYGIEKDLNYNQLLVFLSTEEDTRKEVVEFVNKSKEINPKYYSLSKKVLGNSLNYSRDELEKYAIIAVVGSRNKDLEKEAVNVISSIVGEKTVNRARNEFYKNYKSLIKEIANAFNQGDYEKAINILKQTNNKAINDVINSVNYRDASINGSFVKAVESKNPLDYDNRIQMVCVYLPNGAEKRTIFEYCKDDRIKLVRYDVGNQTLGSAICYLEDKKLLVDSVEGHGRFRKEEIFEIVYRDLIERAKEWGAEIVVFNSYTPNETPRKFLEYLGSKNLKEGIVEMELKTSASLEAGRLVKGYVVRVK